MPAAGYNGASSIERETTDECGFGAREPLELSAASPPSNIAFDKDMKR